MGKDIHVVSMDVETIAVIKKNKKIQHERMRQGNARIIVIHPFVFGLIFKKISVGTFRKTLVCMQNNVMLKLCSNLSNILFKGASCIIKNVDVEN